MLKKLIAGEYSLAKVFFGFGVLGFLLFILIVSITHGSFAQAVCAKARSSGYCVQNLNVIYYIGSHFINLLIRGGRIATMLMLHLIVSGCFGAYMVIVLRGLYKTAKSYKGSGVWVWGATAGILILCLLGIRTIL